MLYPPSMNAVQPRLVEEDGAGSARAEGVGNRAGEVRRLAAGREGAVGTLVVVQGQADLLQVVDALRAAGRLRGRLDGGEQQGDQDGDDRDHHQQLDQGETGLLRSRSHQRNLSWSLLQFNAS